MIAAVARRAAAALACVLPSAAYALVNPQCEGLARPADYSEQRQQDFLQNYFALGTTLSPMHAPVPHEPGHGAIGLDLLFLPPLGCAHRFVLDWTKTEDTTVTLIAPRPRVTFAFDGPGSTVPYAGFAYVPPVAMFGTRNVIVGGEVGVGGKLGNVQLGGRIHAEMIKTVADIATAFNAGDPAVMDLFVASTFGVDAMFGYEIRTVTPYAAIGFTDASTLFLVGDDLVITDNLHPYAGPVLSLGADALIGKRLRVAGELYGATGGFSRPKTARSPPKPVINPTEPNSHGYGNLFTARLRIGYEL